MFSAHLDTNSIYQSQSNFAGGSGRGLFTSTHAIEHELLGTSSAFKDVFLANHAVRGAWSTGAFIFHELLSMFLYAGRTHIWAGGARGTKGVSTFDGGLAESGSIGGGGDQSGTNSATANSVVAQYKCFSTFGTDL